MAKQKISLRIDIEDMDAVDEIKIANNIKTTTALIKDALKDYIKKQKAKKNSKQTIEINLTKATVQEMEEIVDNADYQSIESFIAESVKKEIARVKTNKPIIELRLTKDTKQALERIVEVSDYQSIEDVILFALEKEIEQFNLSILSK